MGKALVAICVVAAALPFLLQPVFVDVAPLAKATIPDGLDFNPHAKYLEWAATGALTDSLSQPEHLFEFPSASRSLHLELPVALDINAIGVISGPRRDSTQLEVELSAPAQPPRKLGGGWEARLDRAAVCFIDVNKTPASTIEFQVGGDAELQWNAVTLLSIQARGVAWLYYLLFFIASPAGIAIIFMFGVVGMGLWGRDRDYGLGVARGIGAAASAALVWILLPRTATADGLLILGWIAFGIRGFLALAGARETRRLLVFAAVFLVVQTQVESYALSDARVSPVDHLHAHYGAQLISRDLPMREELSQRPWLLHVLAAPWDHALGRFGYCGYVGIVAGLNALSILVADSVLRRLSVTARTPALGWLILLPGFANFHFLGQRLLGGMFAVAAVTWLLCRRGDDSTSTDTDAETVHPADAGLAFALGIGLHPSVAFVLLTTALLWFFKLPRAWRAFYWGVALPMGLYAVWLTAMAAHFPGRRNDLLFFPVTKDMVKPFPTGMAVSEVLRSLSPEDWRDLVVNRLLHLRHYFLTTNWTPASWTWGRWISLPNVLCWAGAALLLFPQVWRGRVSWFLAVIVAPLVFHHLFLGQSDPKFHMGPAPFIALMLVAAATMAESPTRPSLIWPLLKSAVVAEIAVRLLWPIVAVKVEVDRLDPSLQMFRLIGRDSNLCFALATLPALCGYAISRAARLWTGMR